MSFINYILFTTNVTASFFAYEQIKQGTYVPFKFLKLIFSF
jgi:hypothetical protein